MGVALNPNAHYTHVIGTDLALPVTLCGWLRIDTDRNNFTTVAVLCKEDDLGSDVLLFALNSDGVSPVIYDENFGGEVQGSALTVGTWYFVAVTVAAGAGNFRYYQVAKGGTLALTDSGTFAGGVLDGEQLGLGGGRPDGEDVALNLDGSLAHWRLWTAALTLTELQAEMASATPVRTSGLWASYRFENTSNATTDGSGNGRNLTAETGTGSFANTDDPLGTTVNATASAALGGAATATATRTVLASLAGALGGSATATATPTVLAALTGALGGSATATATRTTSATAAAQLGFTGTATATRQTAATGSAALGAAATATATRTVSAAATAALGGVSAATAGVAHTGTATGALGFTATAFATDGSVINATASAALGGTATATATPTVLASLAGALGGGATAAATTTHPATAAGALGFAATSLARVTRTATAAAQLGFTASVATQPNADPNPTQLALADTGAFNVTELPGIRIIEEVAA